MLNMNIDRQKKQSKVENTHSSQALEKHYDGGVRELGPTFTLLTST